MPPSYLSEHYYDKRYSIKLPHNSREKFGGVMLNIHYYTDYIDKIGSTRFGKAIYSICAGAVGVIILAIFFAGFMQTATLEKLLPVIVGFNAALTGYMVTEKIRNEVTRKHAFSMGSGAAMVLFSSVGLNLLFFHWAGYNLVGIGMLLILLPVGIVTSGLGGKLCTTYFNLNPSVERRL
jgi:hypothetical protein